MPGENIQDWSTTAATNSSADSSINWAEGQNPSTVNNSARSMMAAVAKSRNLLNGSITTGGSANAQTVTSGLTYISVPTGLLLYVKIGFTNTLTATLNLDGIGAVTIKDQSGNNLAGGELLLNSYCNFRYNGTNWVLLTPTRLPASTFSGGISATTGTFSGAVSMTALTATTGTFSAALTVNSNAFVAGDLVVTGAGTVAAFTATTATFSGAVHVNSNAFVAGDLTISGGTTTGTLGANSGVFAGSVTANNYVTTSDERLKDDLQPVEAGNIVDATEVWDFRWKATDARAYGVMAQHAATAFPYAVAHDEGLDTWGVDYTRYVPILLAEVKALRARVAALEAA